MLEIVSGHSSARELLLDRYLDQTGSVKGKFPFIFFQKRSK